MITFYDLASKEGIKTYSPNPWKTRYVLNYKGLPYKTVTFEYPDVATKFKELGIPPSSTKSDGTPYYTCPSIIDDATGKAISDSYKITEYLDETYPETPRLIPEGTEALQAAFYDQFWELMRPIFPITSPRSLDVLTPRSATYYADLCAALWGKPLSELEPKGEELVETWKKVQASFDKLDRWLGKSPGPFFMGDTITFTDLVVAAMLQGIRVCLGKGSEDWENMMTWNNGRWKAFLERLEPYASVDN